LKIRVINNSQWDLLFPPSGNPAVSKTFDVTLLTVLFRNICGLPETGWDAIPVEADRSVQANIVRIKSYRNEVYAHVTSTQVDNATFESLWQKISKALVELNIPQNEVDELKICPLGPEEVYVGTLRDWKLQEENLKDDVRSIKRSVNRLTQITEDALKQICQSRLEQVPKNGNRNKENDEDLLGKLAKHNFKSKIRGKVKFFLPGTRQWLLKNVDEWFIGDKHESKIFLLTAGPGFGKSVFAAKVCEDFKKKGKLAACHFCDFSDSNLRNPMMMLQSLASQMCENVVGFKEKLLDQLQRRHQVRSLKDAFGIYLQNPLDELEAEESSLIVIDGLDESTADDKNEIVNLIADYFPDLPDFIKILVTSRPEISVAKLKGLKKINIKSNDADNNSDLEIYLRACLPSLPDRNAENGPDLLKTLVEICEGPFLYAFYAQYELQKRDDLDKMTFQDVTDFLPKDLDSIYQTYFKRFEDELKVIIPRNFDVLRILEMLVASIGFLPLTFFTQALGLGPDCRETKNIIKKVNVTVSCLLRLRVDADIGDELRARISWHIVEIEFIMKKEFRSPSTIADYKLLPYFYLQSIVTHSPKGYFSDSEKKIAESILSKMWFVGINSNHEVEVMPLAVRRLPSTPEIRAVGVFFDKTLAAVAQKSGKIILVRVPSLVELWQYSTEYRSISCCIFAPDDSFVLFGKLETVLNITERKEVPFFYGNKGTFVLCAFSPNGKRLVTSNGSRTVKLWDVDKQCLLSLLCAESRVNWCSFSRTGLFIIGDRISDVEDLESDDEFEGFFTEDWESHQDGCTFGNSESDSESD
ncbi:E3 ubiquitin- ligase DZIP3, partial [Paramuricea clavata]